MRLRRLLRHTDEPNKTGACGGGACYILRAGRARRFRADRFAFSGNQVKPKASNIVARTKADGGEEVAAGHAVSFEDAALVERSRKGDMQAFGTLVAKYQDRVFNMVYRMCGRREDAEELAQEAFLKALEKADSTRGFSASRRTW